jgi:hypothetical protein
MDEQTSFPSLVTKAVKKVPKLKRGVVAGVELHSQA